MTFGRRLTLFFLLIVLVPTLALLGVLLVVSQDSRAGKADARLSAGLETATALYSERLETAQAQAREFAADPGLATAVTSGDRAELQSFARSAAARPRIEGVEILDADGTELAAAGSEEAIGFADVSLVRDGNPVGTLRVSTTTAQAFVDEAGRLTDREVVVSRDGQPIAGTITPPLVQLEGGETVDLESDGEEFRAHLEALNTEDDEAILMLGPQEEGGFLAIGLSAAIVLVGFLLLAALFAYYLTRALAGLHAQVSEQAATDPLTQLSNRRRMWQLLTREIDRSLRFGHKLSLLIFDVDDFKAINDLRGHLQGDAVLEAIARIAEEEARSIDVAARYAGDELALILVETDTDGAAAFAERLRARIRDAEIPVRDGGTMTVSVSVGVATVPDSGMDADSLVDAADRALLQAKRAGKDQIRSAPAGTPT